VRDAEQRLRFGEPVARPNAVEAELQAARDAVAEQHGHERERKRGGPPKVERDDRGEREPHRSEAPDVREEDEERIERLRPMMDAPPLELAVELAH